MCISPFAELSILDGIKWELEMSWIAAKIQLGILQKVFLEKHILIIVFNISKF